MKEFPPINEVIELLSDTDSRAASVKFAKGGKSFDIPKWVKWVDYILTVSTYLFAAAIYWMILTGLYEIIRRWFNG